MESIKLSVRLAVVIEMTHWINTHIQHEIDVADVTRQSGYTHWHFQRLFRQITGYTLTEYIRLTRILNVAHALATSDLKITWICFDNGFPNQQALARLFRRYCACSPSEFRKKSRRNPALLSAMTQRLLTRQKTLKK